MDVSELNYNDEKMVDEFCDSLDTLRELIDYRHNLGYLKNIKMDKIFICNHRIMLDECGNAWLQSKNNSDTYGILNTSDIPDSTTICSQCGHLFTLDSFFEDCVVKPTIGGKKFYHKQCNLFNNEYLQRQQFIPIFERVYPELTYNNFKAIPNEYCGCDMCKPWFIVSTPDGDIKIGWRKRVVEIKWLDTYKPFSETFDSEDVTRGFGRYGEDRYIHAWSIDNVVEYLARAKDSIIK